MKKIIDTHAHLYEFQDINAVLRESADAGVSDVVMLGVDLKSNNIHLDFFSTTTRDLPPTTSLKVHAALGLHPGNIQTREEADLCLQFIQTNASKAIAIGECGLDFHYKWVDANNKQLQREHFGRQLDLAREYNLPVVVHSREAFRECLDMVISSGVSNAEFHWYTGPTDVLKDILDKGFFVSCSPALDYSREAQEMARYAPLDRLLIETDTPVRGWKSKDVWKTLKALAALKGIAEDEVLSAVNSNAIDFFGLNRT